MATTGNLIERTRADLLAKGLNAKLVEDSIRRAANKATVMAKRLPEEPDAYRILLAAELTTCEAWVRGFRDGITV